MYVSFLYITLLPVVQPISLRCNSQTTASSVRITCETNRQTSAVNVACYLDGVRQSTSKLSTSVK